MRSKVLSPYWMPVWFFAGAIIVGALVLHLGVSHPGGPLSILDAVFTATSAMCVTGLSVVDTGSYFSLFGQSVILVLIQLGGLGIMTFTTLMIYLLGKRVSLSDRIAVGQTLLRDPSFSLTRLLVRVVLGVFLIETLGALFLWLIDPTGFTPYSAVFHSISAFCNAGFSLFPDSLSQWRDHVSINVVFMVLIIAGGLGFHVLNECTTLFGRCLVSRKKVCPPTKGLSWHSSVVLKMTLFLIVAGAVVIFAAEEAAGNAPESLHERILTALFQSVTCRTAGFNTVDIGSMTNVSLVFMMGLMFIGGSPGSCAGGIKTTTFHAMCSFIGSQLKGRNQVVVGRFALTPEGINKAISLTTIGLLLIGVGTIVLTTLESVGTSYLMGREKFMINMFEVVSAFGTVGLSTGLTAQLNSAEKTMIIILMFVGRVGPLWLLSAFQSWQTERRFLYPQQDLPLS